MSSRSPGATARTNPIPSCCQWTRGHLSVVAAPGAGVVTMQQHVASHGDIWGHTTVRGSSLTAPFHSTDLSEGRGIIPNKTGMRKSAECWAVSREACMADNPSCHHPGHLNSATTAEKLPFPAPHGPDTAHGTSPAQGQEQPLTSPPGSAHSPSTKPSAGRGQLLPEPAGREWENTGISVGSAGMCPGDRAGRQLCNPPRTSLPAGNSGIIPNSAHRQGTPGSLSTIPVLPKG